MAAFFNAALTTVMKRECANTIWYPQFLKAFSTEQCCVRQNKKHQTAPRPGRTPVKHVTLFPVYTHLIMWTLTVFIFCCCKLVSSNSYEKLKLSYGFSLSTELHSGSHWSITNTVPLKSHYHGINMSCQKLWICTEALGNLWAGFIIWEGRLHKETLLNEPKFKILKVATSELVNAFWEYRSLGFANMKTFSEG